MVNTGGRGRANLSARVTRGRHEVGSWKSEEVVTSFKRIFDAPPSFDPSSLRFFLLFPLFLFLFFNCCFAGLRSECCGVLRDERNGNNYRHRIIIIIAYLFVLSSVGDHLSILLFLSLDT